MPNSRRKTILKIKSIYLIDRKTKLNYTEIMQKKFEEMTLKEYNDLLASKSPTPGGGSALCQVGAIACSLIEMSVNVTAAKATETHDYLLTQREAVARAKRALQALSEDDAAAFQRIVDGLRMPKNTDEKVKTRKYELQKAYHRAALVPLDVMGLCRELIRISTVRIAPLLNSYIADDCKIAVDLLRSVAANCLRNVYANTAFISDGELAASLNKKGETILNELKTL